ncbi:MAG TPA: (2Fe-2S)-binding protein [Thermoanaerobaculaceae bacterium]|nr:(2Fe-2S)-binding protein [Thermoanaerobaculaceae bacterium]HRS16386.1 (2Fe-2S)-binding protein [Thermoanaerobaculaceae bacterium]
MGDHDRAKGVTRRSFLATVGAGAAGVAALGQAAAATGTPPAAEASDMLQVTLAVNGRRHRLLVEPRWTLAFVLREKLGLSGTKVGCERGECGACTVLIDGQARYSCLLLAVEVEGHEVTTVEGLMRGEELGPVQQAFAEHDGFQCGYCTPGQIMAAEGLLRANPAPSRQEIRLGMSGNICRCGAYAHIVEAVAKAAALRRGGV